MKKSYVLIHVIKHDMDPNSNINYRRKKRPNGWFARFESKMCLIGIWTLEFFWLEHIKRLHNRYHIQTTMAFSGTARS